MSYQVLARKWRPQRFEEVVGQETVTRTLRNAIRSGRVAHAFLFSGVRGVGKTSAARILAKALNCHQGPTPEPCGQCISCQEIAAGNCLDVLEIDAASNRGIDNIRELRENIRYAAARDRFKIFIIDEAHMLSNEAFNALLKTLEEPPSHVKFVLATTEHHKIPATITSRCQQFEFKSIPFSVILDRLSLIAREEGIEISDYALRAIVTAAQGSMRDAQSALDQIMAFCGRQVQDSDVRMLLGVVDEEVLGGIIDAVLQRERKPVLDKLEEVQRVGFDPQNFCRRLIGYVRNLLICKAAGWDERLLHVPESQREALLRQSEKFSELDLIRFYDLLNRTDNELRWHPHPYIHLEMTLIKLIELAELPSLEEVISKMQSGQVQSKPNPGSPAKGGPPPEAGPYKVFEKPAPPPQVPPKTSGSEAEQPRDDLLSQLLQVVQREALPLYSRLQHASRASLENGRLLLVFPSSERIHYAYIVEPANLSRVRQLCAKIAGSLPQIDIVLEEAPGENQPPDPTEDPRVKAFIETFPGKIIVERQDS